MGERETYNSNTSFQAGQPFAMPVQCTCIGTMLPHFCMVCFATVLDVFSSLGSKPTQQ